MTAAERTCVVCGGPLCEAGAYIAGCCSPNCADRLGLVQLPGMVDPVLRPIRIYPEDTPLEALPELLALAHAGHVGPAAEIIAAHHAAGDTGDALADQLHDYEPAPWHADPADLGAVTP
jgi:hypothetical protein